jgi:hypothetical protein
VQAVVIGKLKNRLGGHNIGMAPVLLDGTMKEIKAAVVEHIEKYNPGWSKKVGGEASIKLNVFDIFDQRNTVRLVNDRSAGRFVEASAISREQEGKYENKKRLVYLITLITRRGQRRRARLGPESAPSAPRRDVAAGPSSSRRRPPIHAEPQPGPNHLFSLLLITCHICHSTSHTS